MTKEEQEQLEELVHKLTNKRERIQRLALLAGITVMFNQEGLPEEAIEMANTDFKSFARRIILASIVEQTVGDYADTSAMLAMAKSGGALQEQIDALEARLAELKKEQEEDEEDEQ